MQMITATLAGASKAERIYQSDLVKHEIKCQQAKTRAANAAQIERAKQIESSRNEWLARDLDARRAQAARRTPLHQRIKEKIVKVWSVSFAAFVLWGEMLGLWEIIDEKENL